MIRKQYIASFIKKLMTGLFRYLFLLAMVFVILYPLFIKISSTFMSMDDLFDRTVLLLPRNATLINYSTVIKMTGYWEAFRNNMIVSAGTALLQTFMAASVGYGFAKFKFRGSKILFACVLVTLLIPPHTMLTSMFLHFRYFDFWGLLRLMGRPIRLTDTFAPMFILAATGIGLKNGLYIFVMRQFYRGIPDELLDAGYIDGAGIFGTFRRIVLPNSFSPMLTVFLLSFAWQWTDTFYSGIFYGSIKMLPNILGLITTDRNNVISMIVTLLHSVRINTGTVLIILPLIILFAFAQRYFIQGIERSGITG